MFCKIFSQIFDSSIADNYRHRHVFMDLLVLADSDGVVDMTAEAVARRTNVPLETVREALDALCAPDVTSRTQAEEGRRLLPIDPARAWGWQIVNYSHYRKIRDEESRREYHREYRRAEREAKRAKKKAKGGTIRPEHTKPGPNESQSANGRRLKLDNKGSVRATLGHPEERA